MTILETLIEARSLITNPQRWCQKVPGRRADGEATSSYSIDESVRYCAMGAVFRQHAGGYAIEDRAFYLLDIASVALYGRRANNDAGLRPIAWVNDNIGHDAVLACYDRAIERAQKESQPS